ncbi:hypothetical protein Lser_V15G18084 [Lactuca serriola]
MKIEDEEIGDGNMIHGPWKDANALVLTLHVDDNNVIKEVPTREFVEVVHSIMHFSWFRATTVALVKIMQYLTISDGLNKIKELKVDVVFVETNIIYVEILKGSNITRFTLGKIVEEHGILFDVG